MADARHTVSNCYTDEAFLLLCKNTRAKACESILAESNPEEIALEDVDDGTAANPEELDIDGVPDDDEDACGASMFAPVEIHNCSAGHPAAAAHSSDLPLPQALANVVAGRR